MTSTSTNQGLDITGRPSSKVLKPPGGGSSDIFGTTGSEQMEPPQQAASRRVKNHFASNLFMGDEPSSQGAPTPSKTPGNSHSNLFGPPSPPRTPAKSPKAPKDQLNLQDTNNANAEAITPVRGHLRSPRLESNGDAHDGGHSEAKTNGNIAAMNGSAAMNGNNIKSVMTNGNAATTNGNGPSPAAPRQRVPPGGYSSGLW